VSKINLLYPAAVFLILLQGCSTTNRSTNSGTDTEFPAVFLQDAIGDPRVGNRKFEQVPAVAATADGKQVFVAWYSGGEAPGPGNYVTVSVSTNQGETWLNDKLVVYPKMPSTRIFDPGLWRDQNGRIHLFFGSSTNGLLWDGWGGVNTANIAWNGSKIIYTAPMRLTNGVISNKPVYLPSKKQVLFPVYLDKPAVSPAADLPASGAFILSNSEVRKGLIPYGSIKIPDEIRIHDEPQIVQTSANGDFLGLVRTTKGIYYTLSSDFGRTWSSVAPFTSAGPTTSARFYIGKLNSGNLLLVLNSSTTRNNMAAMLSTDGGKTWPHKLLLDNRENVSYPDADQTDDGVIHVVFDRDRTGARDILYTKFTEADIRGGSANNVFKTRVNK
jgi:hypothetical protein